METCFYCGEQIWLVDIAGYGTHWLTDREAGPGSGVCTENFESSHHPTKEE
jgi:hypothetical protein